MDEPLSRPKIGLIMSGGGGRAAYQVGVLKAIAEMLPPDTPNPFAIICGASAGAINSTALAIYARNFQQAARRLERVWSNFRVDQVFRADARGLFVNWVRWLAALFLVGMGRGNPAALLDRAPLCSLLQRYLPCDRIQQSIDAGYLHALCIATSGYSSGQAVSFFQATSTQASWKRATRLGVATKITTDHLMASSAIPFVFEAVKLQREYFGDGSMRQMAPMSPAIHLGADRILVIGVRPEGSWQPPRAADPVEYPSLAQIGGHVLTSIFLDALEADLERLRRINETLSLIPAEYLASQGHTAHLRTIGAMLISPSRDPREIAERHKHNFPRAVRFMLRGLGAFERGSGELISYLLFEKPYCQELIALGYADTLRKREELLAFLGQQTSQDLAGPGLKSGVIP
ncbi:MAG: patatin-like phospholipase family protein [Acidiferrobacterales bacterium]